MSIDKNALTFFIVLLVVAGFLSILLYVTPIMGGCFNDYEFTLQEMSPTLSEGETEVRLKECNLDGIMLVNPRGYLTNVTCDGNIDKVDLETNWAFEIDYPSGEIKEYGVGNTGCKLNSISESNPNWELEILLDGETHYIKGTVREKNFFSDKPIIFAQIAAICFIITLILVLLRRKTVLRKTSN